jgi:hypothetical protein
VSEKKSIWNFAGMLFVESCSAFAAATTLFAAAMFE